MFDFSRAYRLVSKQDFQSVFASGKKTSHQYLLALYLPNQKPHARLGLVISKSRLPRAVDRNRLRRIIRESFRHQLERLKGFDIVVLLRGDCAKWDKATLRKDVDRLWEGFVLNDKH